jgi:uncharacterized DUF497 family protein
MRSTSQSTASPWQMAIVAPDTRREYGEVRFLAAAPIDGRLHMLAFTMRGSVLRAISLRRANKREVERYGKAAPIDQR